MSNVVFNVTPQGRRYDDSDTAFWHSQRPGREPGFRGVLARGEPHVDEHQRRCEVEVAPGLCVAWTAREGHCTEPAEGIACARHAEDFAPIDPRPNRLTPEDLAYLETVPEGRERQLARKRLVSKRARQDPIQGAKMLARRRAMRAAGTWSS